MLFFPYVFVCVLFLYSVLMLCFPIYFTFLTIKINRDFVNIKLLFVHFVNTVSGTFFYCEVIFFHSFYWYLFVLFFNSVVMLCLPIYFSFFTIKINGAFVNIK